MLPTTRPDKKKLSLLTSSLFPSGEQQGASTSPPEQSRKKQLLRDGLIVVVSLVLAVSFIVWGPTTDFIAGRAFTITTTNQITYIFYNWTIQLPMDTPSINMQAWNNRLLGHVTFAAAAADTSHILVNIETTAPGSFFKINPWTLNETEESGFGIVIDDVLPNTYGIDYANVVVYIPPNRAYEDLTWNSYPTQNGPNSLPEKKWNVSFRNLTAAGISFNAVDVSTDSGSIDCEGVRANEGSFNTIGGNVDGDFVIPADHLIINNKTQTGT